MENDKHVKHLTALRKYQAKEYNGDCWGKTCIEMRLMVALGFATSLYKQTTRIDDIPIMTDVSLAVGALLPQDAWLMTMPDIPHNRV